MGSIESSSEFAATCTSASGVSFLQPMAILLGRYSVRCKLHKASFHRRNEAKRSIHIRIARSARGEHVDPKLDRGLHLTRRGRSKAGSGSTSDAERSIQSWIGVYTSWEHVDPNLDRGLQLEYMPLAPVANV